MGILRKILKIGKKSRFRDPRDPARTGFYINPSRRPPAVPGGGWLAGGPSGTPPGALRDPVRDPVPGDHSREPRGPGARG